MLRPFQEKRVNYSDYFKMGSPKLHLIGLLGGAIWCLGMLHSVIAGEKAGFAISYGLGQGATMVAAVWGVFIWKEFKEAPKGTNTLVLWMFVAFIAGLTLVILSRFA